MELSHRFNASSRRPWAVGYFWDYIAIKVLVAVLAKSLDFLSRALNKRRYRKSVESDGGVRDVEEGRVGVAEVRRFFIVCLWFEMGATRISNKLEPSEVFLGPAFHLLFLLRRRRSTTTSSLVCAAGVADAEDISSQRGIDSAK